MKERPILFSGPMVRAIQAGLKSQTRRTVKFRAHPDGLTMHPDRAWLDHSYEKMPDVRVPCLKMPFGEGDDEIIERHFPTWSPGERLWVREGFTNLALPAYPECFVYRAEGTHSEGDGIGCALPDGCRWKPSIHMPRRACRLELDLTGIRVERLQQITEADAIAEGCPGLRNPDGTVALSPLSQFRQLWISINGIASWELNPWVWVLHFTPVVKDPAA